MVNTLKPILETHNTVDDMLPSNVKIANDTTNSFKDTFIATSNTSITPNEVKLPSTTPELRMIKTSNTSFALVGDIINYTITIKNMGKTTLNNIIIREDLIPDLEYVGNLTINKMPVLANIIIGVNIGSLATEETSIISFDVKVISKPSSGKLISKSNATFSYDINKKISLENIYSNENIITVYNTNITLIKTCNKKYTFVNDIITYTVQIKNTGDLNALNVIFKDKLPKEVKLINCSFAINSIVTNNINLCKGVSIGTINIGQTVTIKYKVKVIYGCQTIKNCAKVQFQCLLPTGQMNTYSSEVNEKSSSSVHVRLYLSKKFAIDDTIALPSNNPIIKNINSMDFQIANLHYSIIGDSNCSCDLSCNIEKHLLVEGILREIIYYNSNEGYLEHYLPFKIIICIPYCCTDNLHLNGDILDSNYELINQKCVRTHVSILLSVKKR